MDNNNKSSVVYQGKIPGRVSTRLLLEHWVRI